VESVVPPETAGLLAVLREGVPRTRAQLVERTGLARSTVAARLDALRAAGLVGPAGEDSSTGGRPPERFAFRPAARLVVAVDLGATGGTVGLTDLAGTVLDTRAHDLPIAAGPERVLAAVLRAAEELLAAAGRSPADLVGVGIGVPGPVEHLTGTAVSPPIMPGWDRYDVPARIRRTLPVPVLVDNDVNLLAVAEHATVWPDVADLLFVKVATGIGAGVVAGGRLQRGAQGAAGDLGPVPVPATPSAAHAGRLLEEVASGAALARTLAAAGLPVASSADVVDLIRAEDPAALAAVERAGRDIGLVLATCVSLLNPSVIVVGGRLADAGERLLAAVREGVFAHSAPLATRHLRVVPARAGALGGVRGAALLAISHALGS
jgi:predicted NBD/HSP70 family sugar kinase